MWERACSRKRCIRQYISYLNHRFREQARSHSFDPIHPINSSQNQSVAELQPP